MTDPAPSNGPEPKVFSEDYVQSLRTEAANYRTSLRKAEADLTAANAEKAELTTKLAEATSSSGNADARVAAAEADRLRFEVALDQGLPATLARRLSGATREELEADATELLKLTGRTPPKPDPTPGQGEGREPDTGSLSPIQAALQKATGRSTSSS